MQVFQPTDDDEDDEDDTEKLKASPDAETHFLFIRPTGTGKVYNVCS